MGGTDKRIALLLHSLRHGGAERVTLNLAKGFSRAGYQVDLVLAQAVGDFMEKVPDGVRVIDLQAKRIFSVLPGLISYLRKYRPDALLSAWHHINLMAIWGTKLAGVKTRVVVSEHNSVSYWSNNSKSIRDRIVPWLIKVSYKHADAVVAVSKGVADDLSKLVWFPREAITVIYNPIIDDELYEKAREPVDYPWFKDSDIPVILAVGRLAEEKDFPTLIRAFAIVRKKVHARLMILGEGEKRSELEELIKNLNLEQDVVLPGFTDNPYAFMTQARLVVLSSKSEGLPSVLIEALACGTPVVSTDCPSGPREILQDGKYGDLISVGDYRTLASTILRIVRGTKVISNNNKWLTNFTIEFVVSRYLKVLVDNA